MMEKFNCPENCILIVTLIVLINCLQIVPIVTLENPGKFDEIYKKCRDHRELSQVCYGFSTTDDNQCLKSATCEYLVIVKVVTDSVDSESQPVRSSDATAFDNIGEEELSINIYLLKPQANKFYDFWLTNGEESFQYHCTQEDETPIDQNEPTVISIAKMRLLEIPEIDDSVLGCSWSVSQKSPEWPVNKDNKPIDLINAEYWLVLGPDPKVTNELKPSYLPLYHWKYLYHDCDDRRKFCLGANDCVDSLSCPELLVVKLREYDTMYLDFLFLTWESLEKSSYTIDIKPSKRELNIELDKENESYQLLESIRKNLVSLRTHCDQLSCRHKVILPDENFEMKIDDHLLAHSYNQIIGSTRKYVWSLPLVFEITNDQQLAFTFNGKNTMNQVTIRANNLTIIESKIPGLPGYSLREDIYQECETINLANTQSSSSSICFGFNKDNSKNECLKCSTCSVVAILRPILSTIVNSSGHPGIDHESIELQLFGNNDPASIGINFIYNGQDNLSFGYQCLTNKRLDQSQLKEIKLIEGKLENKFSQKISQQAIRAYGSTYCRFIISGDQNTWPLKKNGDLINLIKEEIPIQLSWNHYSQLVDPNGSKNPIYRFKYLYESCEKKENILCIGFDDCIVHRDCTNLVVINYEKSDQSLFSRSSMVRSKGSRRKQSSAKWKGQQDDDSHGILRWSVYSADESDSMVVSFSGDNLYGDDYAILCTPNGFSEHYIWETGKLKPIRETVIRGAQRKYELIPGSSLKGFRCFWSMPGLFNVFFSNYRFDVLTDTVYMNITFQKDKNPTHATRIFTTLPGFRVDKSGSHSTKSISLQTRLLLITFSIFYPLHNLNN